MIVELLLMVLRYRCCKNACSNVTITATSVCLNCRLACGHFLTRARLTLNNK